MGWEEGSQRGVRRSLRGSELADEVVPPLAVGAGPHGKTCRRNVQRGQRLVGQTPSWDTKCSWGSRGERCTS